MTGGGGGGRVRSRVYEERTGGGGDYSKQAALQPESHFRRALLPVYGNERRECSERGNLH